MRVAKELATLTVLLFLPMEWSKVCIAALPTRFTHCIDYQRYYNHYKTADNEYCNPSLRASCWDLCRRNKTEDKCQQRATETESGNNPHCKITTKAEWSVTALHLVPENNGCGKEHHIHYQIERGGHL